MGVGVSFPYCGPGVRKQVVTIISKKEPVPTEDSCWPKLL